MEGTALVEFRYLRNCPYTFPVSVNTCSSNTSTTVQVSSNLQERQMRHLTKLHRLIGRFLQFELERQHPKVATGVLVSDLRHYLRDCPEVLRNARTQGSVDTSVWDQPIMLRRLAHCECCLWLQWTAEVSPVQQL